MDTELKRGARLDLMFPREEQKVPLMASWRYEKGRSAALTTDLEGRWSRNWIQWAALQSFWDKVLVWLHPSDDRDSIPIHEARVGLSANRPFLDLFVYEDIGADSQFRFVVNGNHGKIEGALQKVAAGHYQAALPISAPGDYRIELTEERRGRRVAYPSIGYSLPYEPDRRTPPVGF